MVYEKIRRKQARKDLTSGGLLVFLIVLLCIAVIASWFIGFRTPQNANLKDWFVLVVAVVILGAIIFIILLLVNTFLRDKDARKRLVETFKTKSSGRKGVPAEKVRNLLRRANLRIQEADSKTICETFSEAVNVNTRLEPCVESD